MVLALALLYDRHKKGQNRGNTLALKHAKLIPYTVVLYDKEGTNRYGGCQLPGDRLRWLHLNP